MPEQFAGIREIIKEKNKVTRPILTDEERELIENTLLCSLISEEEILITYYQDGYLLSSYMTVVGIDQQQSYIRMLFIRQFVNLSATVPPETLRGQFSNLNIFLVFD